MSRAEWRRSWLYSSIEAATLGFCGAELLIDREIGSGLLVTTWIDQDAADRADALLDELPLMPRRELGRPFPPSRTCWSGDPKRSD